jgi:hypothetical protein
VAHEITFTRSRPGNKNDGAHVEQKNWTHVRGLVGYLRYDTDSERAVLNEIWELDRVYTNYLLAQQKLIFKQRTGAKVSKRYDLAATPYQRTSARSDISDACRKTMDTTMGTLRPADLYWAIRELTTRLEHLALSKAPAPTRGPVYREFNPSL